MKIAVIMVYVGVCGLYYVGIFTYCPVTELGLSVGAVIRDEQGTGVYASCYDPAASEDIDWGNVNA